MITGRVVVRLAFYNQGSAQDIKTSLGHLTEAAGESRAANL